MRTRLFLDTEWSNEVSRELVSLALISDDGGRLFYAERDPLPGAPSSFVRNVVYPLLERGHTAKSDAEFGNELRRFVRSFENPIILFDAPLDRIQLHRAMTGFGTLTSEVIPFETVLVTQLDVLNRQEAYFSRNEAARSHRHHASIDAEALRIAYIEAMGTE